MQIDRENSRGRLSAHGALKPGEAVEFAASALAMARAEKVRDLILDFTNMSLTRSMSVSECFEFGGRLARAGRGLHKVAFVNGRDCAEPHPFLVTVARNRGLRVACFQDDGDAADWLAA